MTTIDLPTCIIADDHEIVREGVAAALQGLAEVVGTVSTGDEAIALTTSLVPHILFLDVRMPGPGLEAILVTLRESSCPTRVIVFSSVVAVERVRSALDCGALGYLSKGAPTSTLRDALQVVMSGKRYLDPTLASEVIANAAPELSPREYETLKLMALGSQNAGIALELGVTEETVKSNISNILRKLDCTTRTGAVAHALRVGALD